MPIDTKIEGSPGSIRSAGRWLSATLGPAIERGGDRMAAARRTASSEWLGSTGTAFCGALSRGTGKVDGLHTAATGLAGTFTDYAASLESCQQRMEQIRSEASAGGLTVTATTIEDPGAGPARPEVPEVMSQGQVGAYESQVAAYNAHQEKITLYNELAERATDVWTSISEAWETVTAKDRAIDGASWTFTLSDVAGGLSGATLELHSSLLSKNADYFKGLSDDYLARLARQAESGRIPNAAQFYDDLDHYTRMGAGAADEAAQASRLARAAKLGAPALGGILALGGTYYDYQYGGESIEQAAASNLGGFAASVGTGALIGTAIGGPVGTVVGTIVGAGVGVFTSGMIDGLFEYDGDVGQAFAAGVDTVVDTGGALVDLGEDVGGAIVDGIGGLFD